MPEVTVVVHFGYMRPHRVLRWWRRRRPDLGSVSRPWLRYALIAEAAGGTDMQGHRTYKVIGHRWTRRGARHAVDTLRRAQ